MNYSLVFSYAQYYTARFTTYCGFSSLSKQIICNLVNHHPERQSTSKALTLLLDSKLNRIHGTSDPAYIINYYRKHFRIVMLDYFQDIGEYPSEKHGLYALCSNPGVSNWNGPYVLSCKDILRTIKMDYQVHANGTCTINNMDLLQAMR